MHVASKQARERLGSWAKRRGISKSSLARMLGVSVAAASYWLCGRSVPSEEKQGEIAQLCRIPRKAWRGAKPNRDARAA